MKWFSGWAFPASAIAELAERTSQFPMVGSWSLGSFQLLERAVQNPQPVAAVVLISSTPRFCATEGFACGLPESGLRAMQRSLARDARGTLENFHRLCAAPAELSAAELSERVGQSLSIAIEQLAAGLCDLRDKDFRGRVGEVSCPVLLLHGEEDRVIPCDASRWLAANLPNAKLVTLAGAGHDLPLRHADWVASEIAVFAGEIA